MKRIILSLLIALAFVSFSVYATGWKDKGTNKGAITDINTSGSVMPHSDGSTLTIARIGYAPGPLGASAATRIATGATEITAAHLAYGVIEKAISSDAEVGTLVNGTPGQLLTIVAISIDSSGSYTCTPATKTGFVSFQLNTVLDSITLLYFNDVIGWIIIGNNGCTLA
jgi:hypothetical protein